MSEPSKRRRLGRLIAVIGALMALIGSISLWMAPDEVVLGVALGGAVLCLVAALMPSEESAPAGTSSIGDRSPRAAVAQEPQPLTRRSVGVEREVNELKKEIERLKALEQELLASKQLAEAATMAKGEFLATMSHEIRTPLNGIIPLLDLLLGSQLGPDQREYVQTAFGSAKQLLRIVDDILDYSKLEANKLELETTGMNLREVLQGVQKLMEKPAESKGLQVHLQIDQSVRLAVRGDSVRLRQILTNLVSNAVKFTDRGEVVIAVSKKGETRTQHDLRFEVRDTGIGITQEAAEKLFKPFSQADASTTRTFGGTGLGLVICKRIVDLMGGHIGVESELGKGSTFWFQVPMLKAVGDIGAAKHNGLQGARILVLSNDASLMRRLSTAMPQWGATPVPATSSQEAFNKLRAGANRAGNWAFQLLIVDLQAVKTTAQALHKNLEREPGMDQLKECWLLGDDPLPDGIHTGTRAMSAARTVSDPELKQLLTRFLEEAPIDHVTQAEPEIKVSGPMPSDEKLSGHVLLVEDNPVNRQVASRLLTLSGLSLDAAENGKEAVDLLETQQYACVLMDCQMPVMDGYTATRKWREAEFVQHRERMPIVAMTANAMVGDREKCLEAGMDDYITKPLNRGLLEQMLRKWLAQSPHKHPTRAAPTEPPPAVATPPRTPAQAGPAPVALA
ncbi:MAG: response regulator, partial [Xanthomonadales bacterium]|nr:response regulator [Xanthomonadales bacterium]